MDELRPGDPVDDTQPLVGEPLPVSLSKPAPGQVLVYVGEIEVSATTVSAPIGQFPVAGSQWFVQDQWTATQKTPTWAVVCAVAGFCVVPFFSLLFLLAKETVYQGFVHVTVSNGGHAYSTRLPVSNLAQVSDVHNRVSYARSLAAG